LAELERAQLNWRRTQQLLQQKSISQREADNHRTLVKSARAELAAARARYQQLAAKARPDEIRIAQARIAAAKARLEQCRVQLDRTQLKAPTRGQVLKLNVELGELVGPDSPEPALVMADTSCFCVRAFIEELDAPRVEMGRAVKIVADGLPDQTFTGRVTRVSPRMSSKTVWSDEPDERRDTKVREVCIDFDDPVSLVVGLRVDVYIEMKSAQNGEDLASIPVVTGAVAAVQEKPPQMVSR
jgi:multidrug resistance efflux pump